MKRVYQLIAAAVVTLLVPVVASTPTFAVSTCDIGFTGPDSQNMCTSVETYSCTVNNENNVVITNANGQNAASGTVTVGENGTGGGAISGNAGNYSNTTFTVTITNQGDVGVCSATVIVPAVETPPTVDPATPTNTPTVARVLPVTGDNSTLSILTVVAGIAAAVAVISVVATLVYRRLNAS